MTPAALQMSTNRLLNWLLQKKSALLNAEPAHVIALFAEQIAAATALYPTGNKPIKISVPLFKIPGDTKYTPVKKLATVFREYTADINQAIIFSSVATQEVIPHWSDLDILVIIKNEVFAAPERFQKLRQVLLSAEDYLYEFDPWQHHGFQFLTEADLRFYPEAFLPAAALQDGASLLGTGQLSLSIRDSRLESERYFTSVIHTLKLATQEGVLKHHPKNGVYLQGKFANQTDAFYQFKYFISMILLLPSIFVGLVDQPIAKRASFQKITDYIPEDELTFLRTCEKVRLLFKEITPVNNAIPTEVIQLLNQNYFEQAADFAVRLQAAYAIHKSTHSTS